MSLSQYHVGQEVFVRSFRLNLGWLPGVVERVYSSSNSGVIRECVLVTLAPGEAVKAYFARDLRDAQYHASLVMSR